MLGAVRSVLSHSSHYRAPLGADRSACPPGCSTPGTGCVGSTGPWRSQTAPGSRPCSAALVRTRRTLVFHGSLCCTHRSITSRGYTSLSRGILTCSHTLSSIVISRNLYIESSLLFSFLVVCQIGAFLSSFPSFLP